MRVCILSMKNVRAAFFLRRSRKLSSFRHRLNIYSKYGKFIRMQCTITHAQGTCTRYMYWHMMWIVHAEYLSIQWKLGLSLSHFRDSDRIFSFSFLPNYVTFWQQHHQFQFDGINHFDLAHICFVCCFMFWRVDYERADISSNFIFKNYSVIYLDNLNYAIRHHIKWMTNFFSPAVSMSTSHQARQWREEEALQKWVNIKIIETKKKNVRWAGTRAVTMKSISRIRHERGKK